MADLKPGNPIEFNDIKTKFLTTFINSNNQEDGGYGVTDANAAALRDTMAVTHTMSGCANLPSSVGSDTWGTLINLRGGSGWPIQIYFNWNSNTFWIRGYYANNGTWFGWKRIDT